MTALKVILIILLILFLLSLLRVGGDVEYSTDGVLVRVKVGPARFQVYPPKKKDKPSREKKEKKPKKERPPKEGEPESKKGGPLDLVKAVLPLVGEAAGELKGQIRIDRLYLDFTSGGADAAKAALNFGYANMALGMIWPIFEQNFQVRDHRFRTAVDYSAKGPAIYVFAAFSARLGRLISFAIRFGRKFFRNYRRVTPSETKTTKKEAI